MTRFKTEAQSNSKMAHSDLPITIIYITIMHSFISSSVVERSTRVSEVSLVFNLFRRPRSHDDSDYFFFMTIQTKARVKRRTSHGPNPIQPPGDLTINN